jgi:hypothetical protein
LLIGPIKIRPSDTSPSFSAFLAVPEFVSIGRVWVSNLSVSGLPYVIPVLEFPVRYVSMHSPGGEWIIIQNSLLSAVEIEAEIEHRRHVEALLYKLQLFECL